MKERIAFNTRLYSPADTALAVEDLASYALELKKEVTPFVYQTTPDKKVVAPDFGGKPIESLLCWETVQDKQASEASLKARDIILAQEQPFITVWISSADPRYGYERGSMVIGFGRQENGLKIVENYGIVTKTTPQQDLEIAQKIADYSGYDLPVTTNDELRTITFCLKPPRGCDILEFISDFIPFNEVWDNVKKGEVQNKKKEEQKKAALVVEKYKKELESANTQQEHIAVGAAMEREMGISGYSDSGCGRTNSEMMSVYSYSFVSVSENGETGIVHSENGVFCKECPFCHRQINAVIYPGYKCSCGQVFTGGCGSEVGSASAKATADKQEENNPIAGLIGLLFSFIFRI